MHRLRGFGVPIRLLRVLRDDYYLDLPGTNCRRLIATYFFYYINQGLDFSLVVFSDGHGEIGNYREIVQNSEANRSRSHIVINLGAINPYQEMTEEAKLVKELLPASGRTVWLNRKELKVLELLRDPSAKSIKITRDKSDSLDMAEVTEVRNGAQYMPDVYGQIDYGSVDTTMVRGKPISSKIIKKHKL